MIVLSKGVTFISSRQFISKSGKPLCVVTILDDKKKTLDFFADPGLLLSGYEFGDPVMLTFDFNGRGLYLTGVSIDG